MGSSLDELIKYQQRLDKCNMHSKKRNKQECNEELENGQSICHKVVPLIAEEQEDIYEDRLAKAEELAERQRLSSLKCIPQNIIPDPQQAPSSLPQYQLEQLQKYDNIVSSQGICGKFTGLDIDHCTTKPESRETCKYVDSTTANNELNEKNQMLDFIQRKCIPKTVGRTPEELKLYKDNLSTCNFYSGKITNDCEINEPNCEYVDQNAATNKQTQYENKLRQLHCVPKNVGRDPSLNLNYETRKNYVNSYDGNASTCNTFTGRADFNCEQLDTCKYVEEAEKTLDKNYIDEKKANLGKVCIPKQQPSLTSDTYENHQDVLQCGLYSKNIDNQCETSPQTSETCKYVSESERDNQKKEYEDLITSNRSKQCIPSEIGDLRTYETRFGTCNTHSGNINDTKCIGEKGADCSYELPQIAQDRREDVDEMKQANLQKVCFPREINPRNKFLDRSRKCLEYSKRISDLDCTEEQECQYGTKVKKDSQMGNYYREKRCIPKEIHKTYPGTINRAKLRGNKDAAVQKIHDQYYRDVYKAHCKAYSTKPVNECDYNKLKGINEPPCRYVEPDVYNRESSILEGFTNPDKDSSNIQERFSNKSEDLLSNNILPKSILFGCLFFILSHKKSMNILTQISGKLSQTNQNLTMMVIFCFLFFIISKLI